MEKKKLDRHLNQLVEIVLSQGSRNAMYFYLDKLSLQEKIDLMNYMKAKTLQELINNIRNHAENLAR